MDLKPGAHSATLFGSNTNAQTVLTGALICCCPSKCIARTSTTPALTLFSTSIRRKRICGCHMFSISYRRGTDARQRRYLLKGLLRSMVTHLQLTDGANPPPGRCAAALARAYSLWQMKAAGEMPRCHMA